MTLVQLTGVAVCLAASVVSNSNIKQQTTLKWHKQYDLAKQAAQTKSRPLVVVLENPKLKSEKIDETKLRETARRKIAQDKFELVRVDVSTDYGKRVAQAFGAKQFPYTAVTDKKSIHIVFRKAGQMSEKDWTLALARSASTRVVGNQTFVQKPIADQVYSRMMRDAKKASAAIRSQRRLGMSSIQWGHDLEAAMVEAQDLERPVFLFLTAPGCTYCEILKKDALTQQHFIDDLNTSFVPIALNGREHKDLSNRFGVKSFPTLVVLGSSGELIHTWSGYQSSDLFGAHIATAKAKMRGEVLH